MLAFRDKVVIKSLFYILYVPFVCAVLSEEEKSYISDLALLWDRISIARIYPANDYEEFRDRSDLRTEEDYKNSYSFSPSDIELSEWEQKMKRDGRNEFYESVYAAWNVYYWIRSTCLDQVHDERWKEFTEISELYRSSMQERLKNKELLRWPRVVYNSTTKMLTVIPEKFLPKDMTVESEIDYNEELSNDHLQYIHSTPWTGNNKIYYKMEFMKSTDVEIKNVSIEKLKRKLGKLNIHHVIPVSHSLTFANSYFALRNYIESHVMTREQVLWRRRKRLTQRLLWRGFQVLTNGRKAAQAKIDRWFESTIVDDLLNGPGNVFTGPSHDIREDDPRNDFEQNSDIIFPRLQIYTEVLRIYEKQKKLIEEYKLLAKKDLDDENTDTDRQKKIIDNFVSGNDGKLRNFHDLQDIEEKFDDIIMDRGHFYHEVIQYIGLAASRPVPFDPTMWEVSETGKWRLRTVQERYVQYIPNWLENIIREVELETGVEINREPGPHKVVKFTQLPGTVFIFDYPDDDVLVFSNPHNRLRIDGSAYGWVISEMARLIVRLDPDAVETEMHRAGTPTSDLMAYVMEELKKENRNPRILNILRPFNYREEQEKQEEKLQKEQIEGLAMPDSTPRPHTTPPFLILRPHLTLPTATQDLIHHTDPPALILPSHSVRRAQALLPHTTPPTLILRIPGRSEREGNDYSLSASAMDDVLLCNAAGRSLDRPRRDSKHFTGHDDNTLVEILTFGSVDGRTINENIYHQLVNEYQSLALEVKSNASLPEYMKREIANETSSSVLRNVILNICSTTTKTSTTTTSLTNISPSLSSEYYFHCKRNVIIGSTVSSTVGGCVAGATTGMFIIPGLGSVVGCATGLLIAGAIGYFGSPVIVPNVCT